MNNVKKIVCKLKRFYTLKIERLPYIHWFNPLQTLYVNLRCLPLKQALRFPIFVYGWMRLYSLYGSIECVDRCRMGMIKLNITVADAPCFSGKNAELNLWGKIIFHGKMQLCSGSKIMVRENGVLDLGDSVRIMHQCNITSFTSIVVGSNSRISHRSQIFDSNFHYIADFSKRIISRISKGVKIGNDCWICNTVTLSAGSVIPDRSIVASNSLVNKDFSSEKSGILIGGIPAKLLCKNRFRVFNSVFEQQVVKFFSGDDTAQFFEIPARFTREDVL